jgi:hypothetical protein
MNKAALFLLVIGLVQMTGDLIRTYVNAPVGEAIRGIGAATLASPAPKVFSKASSEKGSIETYSTRFFLFWTDAAGARHELELTPEVYGRVQGPYNRRNVYGAALSYGPVLPPQLRDSVMKYALCGEAPLLRELGIDPTEVKEGEVGVRYEPPAGVDIGNLPRELKAPCR